MTSHHVDCGTGVAPTEMPDIAVGELSRQDDTVLLQMGEEFDCWVQNLVENNLTSCQGSPPFNRDGGPTAASGLTVPENMYDDIVKYRRITRLLSADPLRLEKQGTSPSCTGQRLRKRSRLFCQKRCSNNCLRQYRSVGLQLQL